MTPVIALLAGEQLRARVAWAVGPDVDLLFCERAPQLRELIAEHGATAVITQLVDESGADTRPVIGLLHERLPEIRVIIIHDRRALDADELLELGNLGVSSSVYQNARDFAQSLRAALARAEEQSAARAILRRVLPLVPIEIHPFFLHCAYEASRPLLAEDAARGAGFPPRTVRARLRRFGLPSPRRIVRWNRVLHACWRLDLSGRPVKAVLAPLGYETDVALRKQFVRLAGLPIRGVLARGGFWHLLGRFEGELRSGSALPERQS